jgi:hypothetical protein
MILERTLVLLLQGLFTYYDLLQTGTSFTPISTLLPTLISSFKFRLLPTVSITHILTNMDTLKENRRTDYSIFNELADDCLFV